MELSFPIRDLSCFIFAHRISLILEAKEVIGLLKQKDPSVYKTTLGLTPDPFRLYIEELDAEFEAHPCKFE